MKDFFNNLVDKAFILPIGKDIKYKLYEASISYIEDLDTGQFERLVFCFMYGILDVDLHSHIEKTIAEQSLNIKPTLLLSKNIAQFIVVASFKDEGITDDKKAEFSLILMNISLAIKSDRITFPYPESLKQGIDYYFSYYQREAKIEYTGTFKLMPEILEVNGFDEIDDLQISECFDEVQFYCREYAKMQYKAKISQIGSNIKGINDPFAKAYYVARHLANQEWRYVDPNPVKNIISFDYTTTGKKKLSDIKEKVRNSQVFIPEEDHRYSSIILNYFDNISEFGIDENIKMSPREVAIALYYEFILENLNA